MLNCPIKQVTLLAVVTPYGKEEAALVMTVVCILFPKSMLFELNITFS